MKKDYAFGAIVFKNEDGVEKVLLIKKPQFVKKFDHDDLVHLEFMPHLSIVFKSVSDAMYFSNICFEFNIS